MGEVSVREVSARGPLLDYQGKKVRVGRRWLVYLREGPGEDMEWAWRALAAAVGSPASRGLFAKEVREVRTYREMAGVLRRWQQQGRDLGRVVGVENAAEAVKVRLLSGVVDVSGKEESDG